MTNDAANVSDNGDSPPTLSATDGPATNVRWMIFVLSCLTSFLLYLHRYTWGFIKADIGEEFGWNPATLGALDSCFNLSNALGQIPFGIIGDWYGPRVVLGATIIIWSLALGSVTLATGLWTMYAARFGFGLSQAGCYSSLSKITKLWFPPTVRTTVQGWISSFSGRSGGAASNILMGVVLLGALALPWRSAIGILTIVGLLHAVLFIALFRNRPAEHPWANAAEAELVAAGDPDAVTATRSLLKWSTALKSGNMRIFLFQQFTSAFADNLYPYWIPLFLLVQKQVDLEQAGMLAALPLLGGACGGMLGGTLQNSLIVRTGNRRWSRSSIGCIGKMLAAGFMFLSLGFDSAVIILWLFAAVKFFGDWSQPTVWGTCTDIGGSNSASVFSLVNTTGSLAGFVAGPAMGLMIQYFSVEVPVAQETAVLVVANDSDTGSATQPTTTFKISNRPLISETVEITVHDANEHAVQFKFQEGEFVSEAAAADSSAPTPVAVKVNANKAEVTVTWSSPPTSPLLMADYVYTQYGAGWTALFLALGVIYFASAISWLFIDCTKKL